MPMYASDQSNEWSILQNRSVHSQAMLASSLACFARSLWEDLRSRRGAVGAHLVLETALCSGTAISLSFFRSFGMVHDGEGNMCKKSEGNIMSPTLAGRNGVFSWSPCSRQYLHKFLRYELLHPLHHAPVPLVVTARSASYACSSGVLAGLGPSQGV